MIQLLAQCSRCEATALLTPCEEQPVAYVDSATSVRIDDRYGLPDGWAGTGNYGDEESLVFCPEHAPDA